VTYHEDLLREDTVVRELRRLAALVSARLVAESLLGSTVRIKIRWSDFTTRTRQVRLPEPTDHPGIIADEAVALLERGDLHVENGVRLLGVGVAGLIAATFRPGRLFIPDGPPPSPQQDSGPLLLS